MNFNKFPYGPIPITGKPQELMLFREVMREVKQSGEIHIIHVQGGDEGGETEWRNSYHSRLFC